VSSVDDEVHALEIGTRREVLVHQFVPRLHAMLFRERESVPGHVDETHAFVERVKV